MIIEFINYTINGALRRLGFSGDEMTAHGFRAMASTLLNESGKWHPDAIERALAHGDSDKVRAAYHRGAHSEERVEMAQWWSAYLDALTNARQRVECLHRPGLPFYAATCAMTDELWFER